MDTGSINQRIFNIEYLLDCYENPEEQRAIRSKVDREFQKTDKIANKQELIAKIKEIYKGLMEESVPKNSDQNASLISIKNRIDPPWFSSPKNNKFENSLIEAAKMPSRLEDFLRTYDMSGVSLRVLKEVFKSSKSNDVLSALIADRITSMTRVVSEIFLKKSEEADPRDLSFDERLKVALGGGVKSFENFIGANDLLTATIKTLRDLSRSTQNQQIKELLEGAIQAKLPLEASRGEKLVNPLKGSLTKGTARELERFLDVNLGGLTISDLEEALDGLEDSEDKQSLLESCLKTKLQSLESKFLKAAEGRLDFLGDSLKQEYGADLERISLRIWDKAKITAEAGGNAEFLRLLKELKPLRYGLFEAAEKGFEALEDFRESQTGDLTPGVEIPGQMEGEDWNRVITRMEQARIAQFLQSFSPLEKDLIEASKNRGLFECFQTEKIEDFININFSVEALDAAILAAKGDHGVVNDLTGLKGQKEEFLRKDVKRAAPRLMPFPVENRKAGLSVSPELDGQWTPLESRLIEVAQNNGVRLREFERFLIESNLNADRLDSVSLKALEEAFKAIKKRDVTEISLILEVFVEVKKETINRSIVEERSRISGMQFNGLDLELISSSQGEGTLAPFLRNTLGTRLADGHSDLKITLNAFKKAWNDANLSKRQCVNEGNYKDAIKFRRISSHLEPYIKELEARERLPYDLSSRNTQSMARTVQRKIFPVDTSAESILSRGSPGWSRLSTPAKLEHIIANGTFTGKTVERDILRNRMQCVDYIQNLLKEAPRFNRDPDLELEVPMPQELNKEKKGLDLAIYFEFLRMQGFPQSEYKPVSSMRKSILGPGIDMRACSLEYSANPYLVSKYVEIAEEGVFVEGLGNVRVSEEVKILGDGACYFRSVYIGAVESYILSENRGSLFQSLANKFKTVTESITDGAEKAAHLAIIRLLEDAASNRVWQTPQEFEQELLLNPSLEAAMIRACKCLIENWIKENAKESFEGGLTIRGSIELSYDMTLDQYCQTRLRNMREDAEGVYLERGVLFDLLNLQGGMLLIDKKMSTATICKPLGTPDGLKPKVFIKRLGGHYSLVNSVEFVNKRDRYEDLRLEA